MNEVNFVLSLVIILLFIWNFILHNKLEYVANSLNKFKKMLVIMFRGKKNLILNIHIDLILYVDY